jgi:uncharacterized membrane protein
MNGKGSAGQATGNIETVARMEQEFLEHRSVTDRIGDAIAGFAGTMTFVILHFVWLITWFTVNSGLIPGIKPFDPYPFILLAMIVSIEGVLLSTFVLIKQNRMSRRADHRDHLNLQIDLLAEKEITKMLQLQRKLCEHFGLNVANDPEAIEMSRHTAVEDLAQELQRKLPDD